jgi:hypothetical protein
MTTIQKDTCMALKDIKKDLMKDIKWEDNVTVAVKVYDCSDNGGEQTYDVEINYYINGSYKDGFVNDTFYGIIDNEEVNAEAEKLAVKRAKAVLKTVKGWFEYNDDVTVESEIEVYHV